MLFFLLLKAAPAMNHPDGGDADSSPRKIWIEIDSQILNALFCVTGFGLAPWRFRDLYWYIKARWFHDRYVICSSIAWRPLNFVQSRNGQAIQAKQGVVSATSVGDQ